MTGSADSSKVSRLAAHRYEFSSRWLVASTPDETYAVLSRPDLYAEWWPEIRKAHRTGDGVGLMELRSALPLTLRFSLTRDVEDPVERRLKADVDGDIRGFVQWTVASGDDGSVIDFKQVVTLLHPIARRLDFALRPLMEWNHNRAMRGGSRGLGKHLASQN